MPALKEGNVWGPPWYQASTPDQLRCLGLPAVPAPSAFCPKEPICEFRACWHLRNDSFVLCWCFSFFFPSKSSFACISITDEIVGVVKDELPGARFVAADNIVDSSWKGEGISRWGC